MIVDFFRHGTGLSKGCLDYLVGKERDRDQAQVLSGDLELTAQLIDSSPYTKKYTAGCLSFYEHDLPEPDKNKLMQEFERCLFPDMDKDQYQILWVQHQDKNRLELNFVIPNIELTTGKRLQPFYAPVDMERVDLFKRIVNKEYQLHDPDNPENQQILISKKNLPREVKEFKEKLHEYVYKSILEGQISDRNSLVQWLEANDIKVTRQTPKSISIENPCENAKRPIRLSGEIYEQGFRADRQYRQEIQSRVTEYRGTTQERHQKNIRDYNRQLERKSQYHRERYPRSRQIDFTSDARLYSTDQQPNQRISNLARVFIEHNRDPERSENPKQDIKSKPSLYRACDFTHYWSFCADMGMQKQISRTRDSKHHTERKEASHRALEYSRGEDPIFNVWSEEKTMSFGEPECRKVLQSVWHLHDTNGVLTDDRIRNSALEHYRKATESITNRLSQTRSTDENHRRVRELQQANTRILRQIGREEQRTNIRYTEVTESQNFREFTDQIHARLGDPFRKIGDQFRPQNPSYDLATHDSTERNQGADHAFSFAVLRREREAQGLSQSLKPLDTDTLSKAINVIAQREELRQRQAQKRERSSGYSMGF